MKYSCKSSARRPKRYLAQIRREAMIEYKTPVEQK